MDTIIQTGQPAPLFQLPDLNGKRHSLRDYRQRIVVLNFWSAECPWSERVDLELMPLLEEWGPKVALISIASNVNESREQIATVASARRLPVVLFDANASLVDAYGAQITPHFFIIDGTGMVRYQGAFDDVTFQQHTPTQNYLGPAVQALLAGNRPDPDQTPVFGCAIVRFAA